MNDLVASFVPPSLVPMADKAIRMVEVEYLDKIKTLVYVRSESLERLAARDVTFINGGYFLEQLTSFRLMSITGRLRGGKTLLAVALARWLYRQGLVRGVYANMPIDPSYIPVIHSCINTCVILDEAWFFADKRKSAQKFEGYGAFFGKLGSFLISPSVYGSDFRMGSVQCTREVDLWFADTWLYKWENESGDKGRFGLRNYDATFNHYPHRFIPLDDGGIRDTLLREINEIGGSMRPVLTSDDWQEFYNGKHN